MHVDVLAEGFRTRVRFPPPPPYFASELATMRSMPRRSFRRKRTATYSEVRMLERLIVSDPSVMMGKPVVKGTRITVELILEKLAAGETIEQILNAHPRLTREAVRAALAFAAETLRSDVIYPTDEAAV